MKYHILLGFTWISPEFRETGPTIQEIMAGPAVVSGSSK